MFNYHLDQGDSGEPVRMVQKALNEALQTKYPLKTDGQFGPKMTSAILQFQELNGLEQTGVYREEENNILGPVIDLRFLMDSDIDQLSEENELPGVVMKAIRQVEGKADGFQPDGRPIILFERHKFYKYLAELTSFPEANACMNKNPDICNTKAGGYIGGSSEYIRLEKACNINAEAGYLSASYGMFQLMGFNFETAGFSNVSDLVTAMAESEKNQFLAIVGFIKSNRSLHQAVLEEDAEQIAYRYNGSSYKINSYHTKIADAIASYS